MLARVFMCGFFRAVPRSPSPFTDCIRGTPFSAYHDPPPSYHPACDGDLFYDGLNFGAGSLLWEYPSGYRTRRAIRVHMLP
jgi:hypothetical protein